MKNFIAGAVLASAVACTSSPAYAETKTSLCQENTRNRVAIIIKGDGGTSTQWRLALCDWKNEEFSTRITTGRPQKDGGVWTPEGNFSAGALEKDRVSKSYNNAPMPYAIHVHRGIFIHQGKTGGKNASHGCIRVPEGNARTLFNLVDRHKSEWDKVAVVIKDTHPYKQNNGK